MKLVLSSEKYCFGKNTLSRYFSGEGDTDDLVLRWTDRGCSEQRKEYHPSSPRLESPLLENMWQRIKKQEIFFGSISPFLLVATPFLSLLPSLLRP